MYSPLPRGTVRGETIIVLPLKINGIIHRPTVWGCVCVWRLQKKISEEWLILFSVTPDARNSVYVFTRDTRVVSSFSSDEDDLKRS